MLVSFCFSNSLGYQVLPLPLPLAYSRLNVFPGGIWPSTCHFRLPAWYHCSQTPHSIRSIAWGGCRKIAIPHTFRTLSHTHTHISGHKLGKYKPRSRLIVNKLPAIATTTRYGKWAPWQEYYLTAWAHPHPPTPTCVCDSWAWLWEKHLLAAGVNYFLIRRDALLTRLKTDRMTTRKTWGIF